MTSFIIFHFFSFHDHQQINLLEPAVASFLPLIMVLIKLLIFMCALANSSAFSILSHGKFLMHNNVRQTKLYETPPEGQSESNDEPPSIPAAEMIPFAEDREIEVSVSYPIPLPSPVLLGSAMVLGIASIGKPPTTLLQK